MLLAPVYCFVAGILESDQHFGADPVLPVGGGVRCVCTTDPISFSAHIALGERFFLVPRLRVPFPIPYGWWPWTVGGTEIHVATMIWPEPLKRWGVWEAEKYFNEKIVPLMPGRSNRPSWWWQEPDKWKM